MKAKLRLQKRSYAANGQSAWQALTFTAAGRPTAIADFFNGNAASMGYDQYGQLASWNIPSAQYSSIQHDLEGKILSYYISPPLYGTYGPSTLTNTYNIRGELLSQDCQYPTNCASAHGFLYPPDTTDYCVQYGAHGFDQACGTEYTEFDARNGANLGTYVGFTSFSGPNNQVARPSGSTYSSPLNYDVDGRQLSPGAYQYDMENHVDTMLASQKTLRYAFGPDGNLLFSSYGSAYSATYQLTHHWDGGAALATTDANSALQNVLFDKTANMMPQTTYGGITFFDRDFTGVVASAHNSTGYGGVGYPLSDEPTCTNYETSYGITVGGQAGFTMSGPCVATSGSNYIQPFPFFWRTDGYFDGYNVIQGVRSYDGSARQWTSMDAYAGDPMDPLSEQPYV